jgi:acetoin utilization deacetylase AcuC-like enzyme
MRELGVVDDPLFMEHRAPGPHPERPERLGAARRALAGALLPNPPRVLSARDASDDELARVHGEGYVTELGRLAGSSGLLDEDTYFSAASSAAARRAAGAAAGLIDEFVSGRLRYGVALVRPPGHHARPDGAMGFCLLNNVAVAAAAARARGVERVMILDFDVHHGNGTEEMFYDDPSVLYASLHQAPFYPGTGAATDCGRGEGLGYTVNVPLSAGAGDDVYDAAFERVLAPVAEQFAPGLLLISAGFDAHALDPLAEMELTADAYGAMVRRLLRAVGDVPVGLVLEGGYDLEGLSSSLQCSVEALYGGGAEARTDRTLAPRHEAELAAAGAAAGRYWKLG